MPALRRRRFAGVVLAALVLTSTHAATLPSDAAGREGPVVHAVHVKFAEGTGVRLRAGSFVSTTGADLEALEESLARHPVTGIRRLFSPSEDELTASTRRAEGRSRRNLPDLNLYFRIGTGSAEDAEALSADLNGVDVVQAAYVAPQSPPPPSFTQRQGYRNAAATGVDAAVAERTPGGTGGNVTVIDIEYGWNHLHEDLARAANRIIPNGTPVNPYPDDDHGTAVLGPLVATPNAFGVTGIVPDAGIGLVNAETTEGYALANAVLIATSALGPGDVILIEQQYCNGGRCVPSEWVLEVYDAVAQATAAGIIVVAAAGNGDQNLDEFGPQPFPDGRPDSGAIIVGAGEAPGCSESLGPPRSRAGFSSYGSRVNVQGWGGCVVTAGGEGDLIDPLTGGRYTAWFSGTSSAAAIVAATAASLSSAIEAATGSPATPDRIRSLLIASGTPQDVTSAGAQPGHIGPMPDLARAYVAAGLAAAGSNLLSNPGFEVDANADTRPDMWSTNPKFTRSSAVTPVSGTYTGRFVASDNTGPSTFQQSEVVGGARYAVGAWVNAPPRADAFTFEVRVQWRTAGGATVRTDTVRRFTDDTAGTWTPAAASLSAPPTATNARVVLAAGSLNGAIHVDDVDLRRVPDVAPTTSFTARQTAGTLAVAFTDTSSGSPSSWNWDFGDGTTSTQQHPTHTYAAPGTYRVRLTSGNHVGTHGVEQTITVQPLPPPNLLSNAGFEQDGNGDTRPDRWTTNTHFTRSNTTPHGGGFAGRWRSTTNNGPSSYQQVGVVAGRSYTFSGWLRAPSTSDSFSFEVRVAWRTASAALSTTVVARLSDDTAGAWRQVTATVRAPTGATQVRVLMAASSLNATVFVDDFSLAAN